MPLKTKRWNDPVKRSDHLRVLICRYRPRGVRKEDENWKLWWPELGPSKELHAAYYGKNGPPISWDEYRTRYLKEMEERQDYIDVLADMLAEGKTITLLCSSACEDESRCHRSLLRQLIEDRAAAKQAR